MELAEKIRAAKRIYVLGNGGSYANSDHLVNDLLNCGIKAFTIHPATLSAFANDYGWYKALERWIGVVGESGDLLIAMSGSGKSPNILFACRRAMLIGMNVHRIFGAELGQDAQVSEEYQLRIGHELLKALRK